MQSRSYEYLTTASVIAAIGSAFVFDAAAGPYRTAAGICGIVAGAVAVATYFRNLHHGSNHRNDAEPKYACSATSHVEKFRSSKEEEEFDLDDYDVVIAHLIRKFQCKGSAGALELVIETNEGPYDRVKIGSSKPPRKSLPRVPRSEVLDAKSVKTFIENEFAADRPRLALVRN